MRHSYSCHFPQYCQLRSCDSLICHIPHHISLSFIEQKLYGISKEVCLCCRCYRLVLGIDHHKHQLERQQKSFLDIYHSAHVSRSFTETDDRDIKNGRMVKYFLLFYYFALVGMHYHFDIKYSTVVSLFLSASACTLNLHVTIPVVAVY